MKYEEKDYIDELSVGVDVKYVGATLENPTSYVLYKNKQVAFVQDIKKCTKFASKGIADVVLGDFYRDNELVIDDFPIAILPVKIEYSLLQETEN